MLSNISTFKANYTLLLPVSQFFPGLKLKWDLLPWQHLSPLADVVCIVGLRPMHIRYGVSTTAVRQRHSVDTAEPPCIFTNY